jgi:hypothetical protein
VRRDSCAAAYFILLEDDDKVWYMISLMVRGVSSRMVG